MERALSLAARACAGIGLLLSLLLFPLVHQGEVLAQQAANEVTTSAAGDPLRVEIGNLRSLDDAARAIATRDLALRIRALPATAERLSLAQSLANLSTEGDFGRATLQAVTDTLATAVTRDWSVSFALSKQAVAAYDELAALSRLEGMTVRLNAPGYVAALSRLDELTRVRAKADFTLTDLTGRSWTRTALKGHVVLVNFWATWCPPCRKEMPDLDALSREFGPKGLVVLGISDEPDKTVRDFLGDKRPGLELRDPVSFPILLDPGRVVSDALRIDSIPKTFIYDRSGLMVAQSIDMRTRGQFLALLAKAGLK